MSDRIKKMNELQLTDEIILSDIAGYEKRIILAKEKLAELPSSADGWKERKKLQDTKRALDADIKHIRQMIGYATEALNEQN
jgi:hypothetical protein